MSKSTTPITTPRVSPPRSTNGSLGDKFEEVKSLTEKRRTDKLGRKVLGKRTKNGGALLAKHFHQARQALGQLGTSINQTVEKANKRAKELLKSQRKQRESGLHYRAESYRESVEDSGRKAANLTRRLQNLRETYDGIIVNTDDSALKQNLATHSREIDTTLAALNRELDVEGDTRDDNALEALGRKLNQHAGSKDAYKQKISLYTQQVSALELALKQRKKDLKTLDDLIKSYRGAPEEENQSSQGLTQKAESRVVEMAGLGQLIHGLQISEEKKNQWDQSLDQISTKATRLRDSFRDNLAECERLIAAQEAGNPPATQNVSRLKDAEELHKRAYNAIALGTESFQKLTQIPAKLERVGDVRQTIAQLTGSDTQRQNARAAMDGHTGTLNNCETALGEITMSCKIHLGLAQGEAPTPAQLRSRFNRQVAAIDGITEVLQAKGQIATSVATTHERKTALTEKREEAEAIEEDNRPSTWESKLNEAQQYIAECQEKITQGWSVLSLTPSNLTDTHKARVREIQNWTTAFGETSARSIGAMNMIVGQASALQMQTAMNGLSQQHIIMAQQVSSNSSSPWPQVITVGGGLTTGGGALLWNYGASSYNTAVSSYGAASDMLTQAITRVEDAEQTWENAIAYIKNNKLTPDQFTTALNASNAAYDSLANAKLIKGSAQAAVEATEIAKKSAAGLITTGKVLVIAGAAVVLVGATILLARHFGLTEDAGQED